MNKIVMIVVAVIVAVAIAGGSFYGGMAYQRTQANNIRNNFLRSRGLAGTGGTGNSNTGGNRGFFGGGATGQVKSINGNTLTLTEGQNAQNTVTVTLSNTTRIEKTTQGALSDLQPGMQVLVTGQRDTSGNITAVQVLILNNGQPTAATPAP